MQGFDWNDLKFVLALHRAGTQAAAARLLGVNETTVARRLKTLEAAFTQALFHKTAIGGYGATEAGLAAIQHAERIEANALDLAEALGRYRDRLAGTVRVTSVPVIVNRVLVPRLATLRAQHPDLCVELIPEARNLSLSKREADLAIRLARPATGGLAVLARKLGVLRYGLYGPAAMADDQVQTLGWITYDDPHGHLPQAKWLTDRMRAADGAVFALRVADADTATEAVAVQLGKTLLPVLGADRDQRLRLLPILDYPALPHRDIWLLSHRDQKHARSVQAVASWIAGLGWGPA